MEGFIVFSVFSFLIGCVYGLGVLTCISHDIHRISLATRRGQ